MKNQEFKKGAWSQEEDSLLRRCIEIHGEGKWHLVSKRAGLNRCRKSCRLRWVNYLDPNVNRKKFEEDEINLIIRMHRLLGNKWSLIAGRIPGRTANDIKNYFNTHLRKMLESQPNEEEEPERHRVVRPIPRYPTTAIGTGGPPVVSENQHHQLHLKPPPQLPLPEQNEDPVIENNEHTTWWNDTFKFLELEGVNKMNQNPAIPNVGESSTNEGTGMEGMEYTTFQDSSIDWGDILFMADNNLSLFQGFSGDT